MAAAVVILLGLVNLVLSAAHNEAPNANELPLSSEPEHEDARRHGEDDIDEGMPIELPVEHQPVQRRQASIAPSRPTTPEPKTPVYPPLNPKYRRIYNPDERASIEEFPFVAAVLVNKELWCGAAIIDRDRVLTAAHCLQLQYNNRFFREYVKMLTVRVGSSNATAGGEVMRVVEIAFHPNYKPATLEFNVAVLRLHKNLTFDRADTVADMVRVAREWPVPVNSNIQFLGWGSVLGGGGAGGTVLLQKVTMPVYDFADCQEVYGRDLVTHTNFCAGYITIPKNVCNHDAGGPAVMGGVLIGILSFSSKRCDVPDQPAVFTEVGAVAPWLDTLNEVKTNKLKLVKK